MSKQSSQDVFGPVELPEEQTEASSTFTSGWDEQSNSVVMEGTVPFVGKFAAGVVWGAGSGVRWLIRKARRVMEVS